MIDTSRWDVWRVHYLTYAEVLTVGDKKADLVARNLLFDEAKRTVATLGFGYSMHPVGHGPKAA